MWLQNKDFKFTLPDGDKPISRLLTSSLVINEKISDITLGDLFYGKTKEVKNSITGYSILEFLDEKGNISINDKIYNLSFTGDKDNFILNKVSEPKMITYKDKEFSEDKLKTLEERIESFGRVEPPAASEVPTQPQETKTEEEIPQEVVEGSNLFTSEEYEEEKENLKGEGFHEYLTEEKSNYRLLVRDNKLVLIELFKDDYEVLELDNYNLVRNDKSKTFTITPNEEVKNIIIKEGVAPANINVDN